MEILFLFTTFFFFFFCLHFWKENQELKKKLAKYLKEFDCDLKDEKGKELDMVSSKQLPHNVVDGDTSFSGGDKKIFRDVQKVLEKSCSSQEREDVVVKIPIKANHDECFGKDSLEDVSLNQGDSMMDFSDFVRESEHFDSVDQNKASFQNGDYLEDLSCRLAQEIQPQTIELTDYEKEQEDHAIISYQELLSTKQEILNEREEEKEFLENLKKFRNHLS